jgi:hypothetical protein
MRRSGETRDGRYAAGARMRRSGETRDGQYAVGAGMHKSGITQIKLEAHVVIIEK